MFYQFAMLVVLVALGICTIALPCFQAVKVKEYRNDERWQLVQNKANHVAMYYYSALGFTICIGFSITVIFDIQFSIGLDRVLQYSLCAILLRNGIELFALRHFDRAL
ncbi:DUF2178 domain-containing protein [Paenibacillus donghaensis]|uniref:Uncharacterized protein n=1 Tax=Paenibacillus donghaensis TaxID=414771 RepID=A0A2Z2KSE6_9BACL|nr:DUF2178 domain-containing protein [Paenibacillus donghaensis]ASA25819.1 hypothetical protein B9T62_36880 [Paenibacillus donghaensis]